MNSYLDYDVYRLLIVAVSNYNTKTIFEKIFCREVLRENECLVCFLYSLHSVEAIY